MFLTEEREEKRRVISERQVKENHGKQNISIAFYF